MKNPKSETRNPKQSPKFEPGIRTTRSGLECVAAGVPPAGEPWLPARRIVPLDSVSRGSAPPAVAAGCRPHCQARMPNATGSPAHSKTWRPGGTRNSSRFHPLLTPAVVVSPAASGWAFRARLKSALRCALYFFLLQSAFCLQAWGQSYSIDWFTIDGGGGTSTGGVFTVSGTIGQPDAGVMSGGNYTVQGGFWGVIAAVQTPGAPRLSITRSNNVVIVSWPLPAEGWVLQATNALPQVAAPWPLIAPPYQTNGTNLQYIEPAPAGNKFYRLHKP